MIERMSITKQGSTSPMIAGWMEPPTPNDSLSAGEEALGAYNLITAITGWSDVATRKLTFEPRGNGTGTYLITANEGERAITISFQIMGRTRADGLRIYKQLEDALWADLSLYTIEKRTQLDPADPNTLTVQNIDGYLTGLKSTQVEESAVIAITITCPNSRIASQTQAVS